MRVNGRHLSITHEEQHRRPGKDAPPRSKFRRVPPGSTDLTHCWSSSGHCHAEFQSDHTASPKAVFLTKPHQAAPVAPGSTDQAVFKGHHETDEKSGSVRLPTSRRDEGYGHGTVIKCQRPHAIQINPVRTSNPTDTLAIPWLPLIAARHAVERKHGQDESERLAPAIAPRPTHTIAASETGK